MNTDTDSTRYVSAPGTPYAIATVWNHGVVNLATELHAVAESRNPVCTASVGGVLVYRGQRTGGHVEGVVVTSDGLDATGTMSLDFAPDGSLNGMVSAMLASPCGPVATSLPLQLQPEVPQ